MPGLEQAIRFVGAKWPFLVLIRPHSPSNSCVLEVGTRNHCVFRPMSMPSPCFGVGVLVGESAGFAPGAVGPLRGRVRDRGRSTHDTQTSQAEFENASTRRTEVCSHPLPS